MILVRFGFDIRYMASRIYRSECQIHALAQIALQACNRLVCDRGQRGALERKIRGKPGIFGERQHMAERRSFGDTARGEVGSPERKLRRGPALRQSRQPGPALIIATRARQASSSRSR